MHETHSQSVFATPKGLDVPYGHSIDASRPKLLCRFRHPVTADNRSCFQDHSVNTRTVLTTIDSFFRCCRVTDLIHAVQHLFRYESCGDPWANIVRLTMRPLHPPFFSYPDLCPDLFRAPFRAALRVKARLPRDKMPVSALALAS